MKERRSAGMRGFEVVSAYREKGINIPERKTARSAGYDIESAEDVVIPADGCAKVPTGIKAFMQDDEYLGIHIRSGLAFRKCISLVNDEGVIDADYYNNPDNEGHIVVGLVNHSGEPVEIKKGERIAQGIFKKYLLADGDDADKERLGGFGSTGK
ncbi:deoxyuridine 5'-triphosphate nucleotidohydrolase [bacterium BMS3Bbin06]|nr:deoxyuridine 5'-triphosphate nucleotidohydrolase [bacterium BMS3Bbin06]